MADAVSFTVMTKNKEVWNEFFVLKDQGFDVVMLMNKVTPDCDRIYEIIVNLSEGFTSGVFANLFCAILAKHGDKSAQINEQKIPPHTFITPIYIEGVVNSIVVNNYAERKTDKEPEDTRS